MRLAPDYDALDVANKVCVARRELGLFFTEDIVLSWLILQNFLVAIEIKA